MLLVIDTSCIISTVTILQRYIAYIQPNFYDCKALQNTRSICNHLEFGRTKKKNKYTLKMRKCKMMCFRVLHISNF